MLAVAPLCAWCWSFPTDDTAGDVDVDAGDCGCRHSWQAAAAAAAAAVAASCGVLAALDVRAHR